ncbi:MAG: hypothetical protein NTY15_13290 [Planctomycetota bacterium]|nr:hypothetical protein [Planctomycetota bacterium]
MNTQPTNDENSAWKSQQAEKDKAADALAARQPLLANSICLKCTSHRSIVSGKGSVFMLCQSDSTPSNWPKYPPQPLTQCRYYDHG